MESKNRIVDKNLENEFSQTIKFKNKLLAITAIIIALLCFILVYIGIVKQTEMTEQQISTERNRLNAHFTTHTAEIKENLGIRARRIAQDPSIIKLFASRDKTALLKSLNMQFTVLGQQEQLVDIIHFVTPDNRSFLRLHDHENFGDDISSFRPMIVATNKNRSEHSSLEGGVSGWLYRVAVPIFDGENYIGLVEVGLKVDRFMKTVHGYVGQTSGLYVSTPQGYKLIYGGGSPLSEKLASSPAANDMQPKVGKKYFAIHAIELKDITGKDIAKLLIAQEITRQKTGLYQFIAFAVGGAAILFWLAFFAIRFGFGLIFSKLDKLNEAMSKKMQELQGEHDKNLFLLSEYKQAVDKSNIVSKTDVHGIITYVNEEFCKVSGYSNEELIGKHQNVVRHENMPKIVFKQMWETILAKKIWRGVVENKRKDGESYFVDATIIPILDINGNIIEFLGIRHDITDFIRNKKALYTNSLTGLPNRYKMLADLESANDPTIAIVNIDSFKEINDFFGHKVGDFVLKAFGERLKERCQEHGFDLYKLSSDEYAVLCENCEHVQAVQNTLQAVEQSCNQSFTLGENDFFIRASIGFACGENLLSNANMALKYAKTNQKAWALYDESMNVSQTYEKNIKWSKKLRHAIASDRITPFFQPIAKMQDGTIEKYECLVRLIDDDDKAVGPYFFLDAAKKSRVYPSITKAVVIHAFELFENRSESFSINLSVDDIINEETVNFLRNMLLKYKNAHRVIFEILESEGIENYQIVNEFVTEMKELGCKIAIDDFGSGYSNFEHILKLKVDFIKIDGSLIKNIDTDINSQAIVETIVGFAKRLGIGTIAEFVHSEAVYEQACRIGIDYLQGYYIGEPKATV